LTTNDWGRSAIAEAAAYIMQRAANMPSVGVVLGSGLGQIAESLTHTLSIPYASIPHFVPSTVQGHKGELTIGQLGKAWAAVMNGRLHYYEGYTLQQATFPIRVLKAIGCRDVIITNAAGGLNPAFQVGDLMLITDHINMPGFAGQTPLFGPNDDALGPRFPDMHDAYSADLRRLAKSVASKLGMSLREGVYIVLGGPAFETPAEVRFLRAAGADAVGMSTVAEVIVARHGGQRVLGISMISNVLSPAPDAGPVNHEEVLAAGADAARRMVPLITGVIAGL
jgi:purine-nucleoside phosphorylase